MERRHMMKRSRHVIVSQILDICRGGANKTKIVYQANLNFRTVNPYLELLIENELLTVRRENTLIYETTERGASLLDNFRQINDQLSELNMVQ